jgi:hypothetical protein
MPSFKAPGMEQMQNNYMVGFSISKRDGWNVGKQHQKNPKCKYQSREGLNLTEQKESITRSHREKQTGNQEGTSK